MRVLVTGGAGYIGAHTVLSLLEAGHQPTVFDNLSTGHRAFVPAGVPLVVADLLDGARLEQVIREGAFDGVIHFAARALVEESTRLPELYYRNNLVGTFHLLEALRASTTRRLVFSSSCSVYGIPETDTITEESPRRPIHPYGFTKSACEEMIEQYRRVHGIGYTALRYFNAAGADPSGRVGEDHDPETHAIPCLLAAAAAGRPFRIHGTDYPTPDGTCVRDYVHVTDLAAAHLLALEKTAPATGEALNVGSGQGTSIRELAARAARVLGRAIAVEEGPRRAGDPPRLVARADRIRERWGWQARLSGIDTILETAWRWHGRRRTGEGRRRP